MAGEAKQSRVLLAWGGRVRYIGAMQDAGGYERLIREAL